MGYTKPPTWIVDGERIVAVSVTQAVLTLAARRKTAGIYKAAGVQYVVSSDRIGWKCREE